MSSEAGPVPHNLKKAHFLQDDGKKKGGRSNVPSPTIKVYFDISSSGEVLKVDPYALECYTGDEVAWECKESKKPFQFAIRFRGNKSPFDEPQLCSDNRGSKIGKKVICDPFWGRKKFHYIIAAHFNDKLYILDPDLIIKKPPKKA